MTAALATLNPAAQVALTSCEQRIERGMKTFIDVGQALAEIRDSRLYRGTHPTFEDYCQDRWGFSRQRAQQFTAAAELATTIVDTGLPAPTNEGQARALAAVPEDERAEVWRDVVESGDKPTAAAIRKAAEARAPQPSQAPEPVEAPVPAGSGSAPGAVGAVDPPAVPGTTPEPVEAPSTAPAGSGSTSPAPDPASAPAGDLRAQVLAVLSPEEQDAWGLDEICQRLPGHGEPGQARPGEVRMVLADLVEAGAARVGQDVGGPYWWKVPPKPPTPPPGSPATWTDEEREANRLEVARKAAIAACERAAESMVLEITGMVTVIIDGLDNGAPGIPVSLSMIAECRAALDRLEARVINA